MYNILDFITTPHKYKYGSYYIFVPVLLGILSIFIPGIIPTLIIFVVQMMFYYFYTRRISKFFIKRNKKTIWLKNGGYTYAKSLFGDDPAPTEDNRSKLSYYTKLDERYISKEGNIWKINTVEILNEYYPVLADKSTIYTTMGGNAGQVQEFLYPLVKESVEFYNKKKKIKFTDKPIFVINNRNHIIDSLIE